MKKTLPLTTLAAALVRNWAAAQDAELYAG
jgi:hypothetical protein